MFLFIRSSIEYVILRYEMEIKIKFHEKEEHEWAYI